MNRLKWMGMLALFVFGITAAYAQESTSVSDEDVAITLERTPCFGGCPVYSISILNDGTVVYQGIRFVEVTGEQRGEIDPETVAQMVEAFADAGYFDWEEAYDTMTISDLPSVITSVTRDGETHRITRYTGDSSAPVALSFLEQWIDEMTNSVLWTGVQPDISTITDGTSAPAATLQRRPCFGMCPVYSVAAYPDGTVIYTGIANVNTIGVQVFEVDEATVASIADRAQISGYFDWQDSYQQGIITDQATVTTTISWEDQFKRIVRYAGDPNAPVGLLWVEESIDQLVSDYVGG